MNNFRAGTQIMKQALPGAESTLCHWRVRQFLEKLDKQPNNKVLDLNNCALNASDIKELTAIIPLLPDLEEIDLSWNDFIGGALQTLTLQFSHMQELKVLRLNNCRLTAKDITFLAQLLHRIQNLEELDLSINKNIGCSLKSIAQELKYVSGLKVLNLHMCGLKQDGFPCLDDAFQHIPELKKLDVSCNKEMGGGFQNSAAHLANLINLEVLDLHQCRITEEDMAVLTQIIPLLSSLQELDLSSNKSVGISSDNLLSRFRFLPKLKSVLLSNCSLLQNSFASLAEAALHLPELKILDLSWNKCVGGNLKLILKALNLEAELQELRLSSCSLVDKDLACLALVIQDGPLAKLQKLDLSYNNHISDQGWSTFYQGIVALEQLSELDVSLRPASRRDCGEWFGKLLAAMPKLPILSELDLQGWILSERQQKQLESCNWNNEQNVHFDT
ncbi:leucine-rich repeat-containing protein 31 isoform X2 [Eublepharis macularius]|uniref:Leucine-rich repeat-containing protein 31 isoform X2 n=1 Tax=Eublepharis macularius TaxID=481883 RepID=A0AA97L2N4_EUBMA|nr:leucine-rich repeat-containing protein 31 isoform X2 [Eublepharis macularius]